MKTGAGDSAAPIVHSSRVGQRKGIQLGWPPEAIREKGSGSSRAGRGRSPPPRLPHAAARTAPARGVECTPTVGNVASKPTHPPLGAVLAALAAAQGTAHAPRRSAASAVRSRRRKTKKRMGAAGARRPQRSIINGARRSADKVV